MSTRAQGRIGEELAREYLERAGFTFITQNVHFRDSELDLIMKRGNLLVFVEVKWRRNGRFGTAGDGISWKKRKRLRSAVVQYLLRYPHQGPIRIDALLLDGPEGNLRITHVRGIE